MCQYIAQMVKYEKNEVILSKMNEGNFVQNVFIYNLDTQKTFFDIHERWC